MARPKIFDGCDGDCFHCRYDDCTAPYEVIRSFSNLRTDKPRNKKAHEIPTDSVRTVHIATDSLRSALEKGAYA